jgi:DNA-binding transcriptional ArsR family regulator
VQTFRSAQTPVRFAVSPLTEAVLSARLLDRRSSRAFHGEWIAQAWSGLDGLDLAPLEMFMHAPIGSIPDFSAPPPRGPFPSFDDEIASLRRVSPSVIRSEVDRLRQVRGRLARGAEYYETDPQRALTSLADTLEQYWNRVVHPVWPRARALLEGDIGHRARDFALYGSERLFSGIRPRFSTREGGAAAVVAALESCAAREELLLLPSVFAWPDVYAVTEQPWQPTLVYPAYRAADLDVPARGRLDDALSLAIGRTKARLLRAARVTRSVSELARAAGISPAAASQLLTRLANAGLVRRERRSRRVVYDLSERGRAILIAFD